MRLQCKVCGLPVEPGRPDDPAPLTPRDRLNYRHMDGRPLCAESGLNSMGKRDFIPTLPIPD